MSNNKQEGNLSASVKIPETVRSQFQQLTEENKRQVNLEIERLLASQASP